jgi:hypothetical protein
MPFVDDFSVGDAAHLSIPLFHSLAVRTLVNDVVIEFIGSFPMLLALKEVSFVFTHGLLENTLVDEKSLGVKFAVIAVLVFFSGLLPPFELSAFPNSFEISPFKNVIFSYFLAFAFETVVFEPSSVCVLLAVENSSRASRHIIIDIPLKVGAIWENVQSISLSPAMIELAYEERAIRFVHFADSMG